MATSKSAWHEFVRSLLSRKFLIAIVGAAVVFGNYMWNWGLTEAQVWSVLAPLLTYMGVEGFADIKSR
ncbi:hypothetical protein [Arthrobacter sp. EpRS71]|uniref:hypothetical protein n=1 Tax=Arthrobacter sp. EpRS71 TaxID=1743141 RepID=UPI000749635A|nr:hypothetical protein [Arthrobacter sp. EpRS71]KUM39028.1 hypothetical protein AR689_07690 [Arthrobacter sp. EpRS71]